MENVKKQVKHLIYTTKSLEEKAKNIDRCNREGAYDTDRPWEELILGLLELRKQVDDLLALHGWKEIDRAKPQPCTKYRDAETLAWVAKLVEETHEVIQEAARFSLLLDEEFSAVDDDAIDDSRVRLAEELTDVITLCTSWLYAIGFDEGLRDWMQKHVNEKNKERGYF